MIAGLMDNRVTQIANKFPGLGDIPILGNLFQKQEFAKEQFGIDGAVHGASHFTQHAGTFRTVRSAAVPRQR